MTKFEKGASDKKSLTVEVLPATNFLCFDGGPPTPVERPRLGVSDCWLFIVQHQFNNYAIAQWWR